MNTTTVQKPRPYMYYGFYVRKYRQSAENAKQQIYQILGRTSVKIYDDTKREQVLNLLREHDYFASPSPNHAAVDVRDFLDLMRILKEKRVHVKIPPIDIDFSKSPKVFSICEETLDDLFDSLRLLDQRNSKKGRPGLTFNNLNPHFKVWYFHCYGRQGDGTAPSDIAKKCNVSISTIWRWIKIADNTFRDKEIKWLRKFRKMEVKIALEKMKNPDLDLTHLDPDKYDRDMVGLISFNREYEDSELIELYRANNGYQYWKKRNKYESKHVRMEW